jgi:hypothetical protein
MTEENTQAEQTSASQATETTERNDASSIGQKSWLTGPFGMAICCAAPLLLVAAVTLFGISLGALASGFLSLAALVACPVGMYLMMRMMAKQNAGKAKDGDN